MPFRADYASAVDGVTRRTFIRAGTAAVFGWPVGLRSRAAAENLTPQAPRFLREWGRQGEEEGAFHFPIGVALTPGGQVFVSDHYNNRVQRFDADGKFLHLFEVLPHPGGIALDRSGNVILSHFPSSDGRKAKTPDRISMYSPQGKFVRTWGQSGSGDGDLNYPGGVAVASTGRIYVADQTNRRVQVFDNTGKFLGKWGEYGVRPGQFGGNVSRPSRVGGPQFIALDPNDNVYTTEGSMGRVQKFTPEGKFVLAWGDNADRPGSFGGAFTGFKDRKASLQGPVALCIDPDGHVWISAVCGRIQQFTAEGKFLRGFGRPGTKPGEFYAPHGVAVDAHRSLYVVDAFNHRIQKFAL